MPHLQLSLELLESSEVNMEKHAISWYGVKRDPSGENVYCGQDESCLRYLHLPENLDGVHFDLNMRHPDDEYKMFKEDKTVSQKRAPKEDLLLWIKDVGFNDKRWYTPPSNLILTIVYLV
jgi:hypothetical protein